MGVQRSIGGVQSDLISAQKGDKEDTRKINIRLIQGGNSGDKGSYSRNVYLAPRIG